MITIIHGDSLSQSREYFLNAKAALQNVVSLDGQDTTEEDLINFFSGGNLFYEEKNLSIENLLSRNKAGKNLDQLIIGINENGEKSNIILWEEKEVSQKNLNLFPKAQIQVFKIPKIIFNFLDSIKSGNGKNIVIVFHKLLENTPVEIILFMIVRQLRLLIAVSSKDKSNSIEELQKIAPWQEDKLRKQAISFDYKKLISLYRKLYNIDSSAKTGTLSVPIVNAIDFLLLDI